MIKRQPNPIMAAALLLSFLIFTVEPYSVSASEVTSKESSQNDGYLVLETHHKGLAVKIDEHFVGLTPLTAIRLTAGLHKVVVENPYRSNWLDQPWFADVNIPPSDTLAVQVNFKKSISINSKPFAATVFVGKTELGETPIFFLLQEGEADTVTLTKSGYVDTSFVVGKTDQRFFNITLTPSSKPLDVEAFKSNLAMERRPKSNTLLYTAFGLSVVSGALALYFRNQGNSNYDRYLNTGDPALMNRYLDKANKFDNLAVASFGVFQVSFIFAFYKLVKRANQ